ncbi:hypothetical protein ACFLT1_01255 [Bacteroidota bacterium]
MKIAVLLFIAMLVLVNSCQEVSDPETEKEKIIEVINAETQAYMDFDFEKVISFYVQDSLNFRLSTGTDDHVFLEGWDEVEDFFRNELIDTNPNTPPNTHVKVSKDNYRIKLFENAAFVLCTEKWTYKTPAGVIEIDSQQVRFMEKVDDEWKIAFLSFVGTSGYEQEGELEELGLEFNTAF